MFSQTGVAQLNEEEEKEEISLFKNHQSVSLQSGHYKLNNDCLSLIINIHATDYHYEFQMMRKNQLPKYKQAECDGDYLDLYWSGF